MNLLVIENEVQDNLKNQNTIEKLKKIIFMFNPLVENNKSARITFNFS